MPAWEAETFMTEDVADRPDATAGTRDGAGYAASIGQHLALPIREYFKVVELEPLPAQLAALVSRFEAAVTAHGETVPFDFRGDIIKALPALRTFALSLVGDVSRADDLVQETFVTSPRGCSRSCATSSTPICARRGGRWRTWTGRMPVR
jgi:hypothetical protein